MRDSRAGPFGVTALVLVLLAQVASLDAMTPVRAVRALLLAGVLSRLGMLALTQAMPYVRESGLGSALGGRSSRVLVPGLLLAALLTALTWPGGAAAALAAAAACGLVAEVARRRIGGATGDVYGAACALTETAVLVTLAAIHG